MRSVPIAAASLLIAALLSGCAGDSGTLKAVFVVTPKDANRSTFVFDASASTGKGLSFTWDFGDGTTGDGEVVQHTYQYTNGDYAVALGVKDSLGLTSTYKLTVPTGTQPNQNPVLCMTVDGRRVAPNQEVVFDATQSYDADGEPLSFAWDFNYQDRTSAKLEFEDLGHQQYGHAAQCMEAAAGGDDHSGHSQKSSSEAPAIPDLGPLLGPRRDAGHGGDEGPPETYNTGYDGRSHSPNPIQVSKFPSPATYYVLVKALDPKGAEAVGFIRVMVEENAAAAVQTSSHTAKLHYGTDAVPPVSGAPANKTDQWRFRMAYPGLLHIKIEFKADNQEPELQGWICGAEKAYAQCKAGPTKIIPKAKSPIEVSHTFTTATPGNFQLLVENVGTAVNVDVTETLTQIYDTNPWYATESGIEGGHSGH